MLSTKKISMLNTLLFIIFIAVTVSGFDLVVLNVGLTFEKGVIFTFTVLVASSVYFLFDNK